MRVSDEDKSQAPAKRLKPEQDQDHLGVSGRESSHLRSSEAEETENKDVTDSGYSNSCSNSQSQRSGSSKCSGRNSAGSSGSGSSTFGVLAPTLDGAPKDGKERKDKKKEQDKKNRWKKNRSGERSTATSTSAGLPAHNEEQFKEEQFSASSSLLMEAKSPLPQPMETGDNLLQVAALSQTLHMMRKMKYPDINSDDSEGSTKEGVPPSLLQQSDKAPSEVAVEQIASLKSEPLHEGELRIAVSMLDGVVIYTSGLTQALGYPKDMWIGRSLIDFVHSKHRASFASFIIQSLADLHPGETAKNGQRNVYFCCLRKYRGLKLGFQVSEQTVKHLPCQITLQLKKLPPVGEGFLKECLIITAVPVRSAYKHADETRMSPKFMTRHSVNCQLVHVDPEVTPYFGYLPQDMLSRSILDFYHPEDLHFLKEVYEAVIKEQGHPFRSKPYRFLCQNGGYALIETELSSFINPWTRKPEFIIGQHSVLRGPPNPDVTTPCADPEPINISEEVLKETKIVQEEIKCLMNETVVRSTESAKQQVSKRCKDLAAFMENLMDEITKPPDLKIVVPTEEQSFSERDSVMLGEISPHHDYYDSKSMSETPPSYNQLNYNENIHRFFESKPKTTVSDESSGSGGDHGDNGDTGDNKTGSSGEEGNTLTVNSSSGSKSGDSGASSGQSTGSHGHSGETNSNDTSNNSNNTRRTNTAGYKPPALTEQLLSRHNEDMEKQMVQKHRVSRTKSDRDLKVKERLKTFEKGQELRNYSGEESGIGMVSQGVKRSGSHSWEGEPFKAIKASHVSSSQLPSQQPSSSEPQLPITVGNLQHGGSAGLVSAVTPLVTQTLPTSAALTPLWPPYPSGSSSTVNIPPTGEFPGPSLPTGALMPMYYLPNQHTTESVPHQSTHTSPVNYTQSPVQLMPSMLYHPFMYGTPPIQVYSPMMYPSANFGLNAMSRNTAFPPQCQNAVKTERETNVPSRSSPLTGTNTPRKEAPPVSNQKSSDNEGGSNEISTPYDDSSYQSSFYSFLKTDKSDESMISDNEKLEERGWGTKKDGKCKPIRKVAPWIENVNVTSDLMFKYQLKERGLAEILRSDAIALEKIKQPSIVNDQLSQMYEDLEIEGLSKNLTLDEGITSSSESSGDDSKAARGFTEHTEQKRRTRYMEYDKMTILFEEDAPMPPPIAAEH